MQEEDLVILLVKQHLGNDESDFKVCDKADWLQIKEYWKPQIKTLYLKFRSHVEKAAPDDAEAYAYWEGVSFDMTRQQRIIFVGYVQGGRFYVSKWAAPELLLLSFEERDPANYEKVLIYNGKKNN